MLATLRARTLVARASCRVLPILFLVHASLRPAHAQAYDVLVPPDLENKDRFGQQVVTVGEDLAFASEPGDGDSTGSVSLYARTPLGWEWRRELVPAAGLPIAAEYGASLDVADGVLVSGAIGETTSGYQSGAAYVFEQRGGWHEVARLHPPGLEDWDRFGTSVATSGSRILVGAIGDDDVSENAGAGYLFERGPQGWNLEQKLLGTLATGTTTFLGVAASIDGDVLVLAGMDGFQGIAFVFEPIGGAWVQTAVLVPGALGSGAVNVQGDIIVIGATGHGSSLGSLWIWERTGPPPGNWTLVQRLEGSEVSGGDRFGFAVDQSGDELLVGAPGARKNVYGEVRGRAYLFARGPSGWVETKSILGPNVPGSGYGVGQDVAFAGSHWLLGDRDARPFSKNSGAVFVYDQPLGRSTCPAEPNSTGEPARMEANGSLSARAGDLVLRAKELPADRLGMFLVSREPGFVSHPGGSAGNLCLAGLVGRFRASVASSGPDGEIEYRVDTRRIPQAGGAPILPGETWHFQCWFRDPVPGARTNFSDGLGIRFE